MILKGKSIRIYTIAVLEDISYQSLGQRIYLPAAFRICKIAFPYREVAQSHDHHAGGVSSRAAGHAGHALATVPYGITLEQFLDLGVILPLDGIKYLAGIILVELCGRAYRRTGAAVYTGLETFLEAVVASQFVIQFSHCSVSFLLLVVYFSAIDVHLSNIHIFVRKTANLEEMPDTP